MIRTLAIVALFALFASPVMADETTDRPTDRKERDRGDDAQKDRKDKCRKHKKALHDKRKRKKAQHDKRKRKAKGKAKRRRNAA